MSLRPTEIYLGRLLNYKHHICIVRDVRRRVKIELYTANGSQFKWVSPRSLTTYIVWYN